MWIKRKKFVELEKRIADLEEQVQSQQSITFIPETSDGACEKSKSCKNTFL